MNFLSWFDWITPTSQIASLFFGALFTLILVVTVWLDTRKVRTVLVTFVTGIAVSIIGVLILSAFGYYT
ncbi:hypothetical protein [Bacillus weihaiensis]|uniref:Uncharacterized protein n=1 Tax=Bacillus weihaiensis TaxID=1547283 RepID=A0A1L3MVS0_9BACI|nr:hypothetical protein [Bacillus weihaiensis]APH06360.1 hypothetical protein A9C19_17390 [Bacillus weihaiensis]